MKKILIIEDEKHIRERILDTLELAPEQYELFSAENGRVGIEIAQRELPDLIISDIMMPEVDGFGVLATLRKAPQTATIPIIFLSAKADSSHIREGMNLGADDYLPKPFGIDELLKVVSTRLEKQELQQKQSQEQLSNLRVNIAYALPHEFRTPLSAIMGFADLLKSYESMERDSVMMMIDQILHNTERLQRLVENFLLFAQIEIFSLHGIGGTIFREGYTEFTEKTITETVTAKAMDLKRSADIQMTVQPATIDIPNQFLQKVIDEVIDNALKFSPAGTSVQVNGKADGKQYVLSIRDEGRGMTSAEIANIGAYIQFERRMHEQQGAGLGLAIARRLVQRYNGDFIIRSDSNKGTEIEMRIPLHVPQTAPPNE